MVYKTFLVVCLVCIITLVFIGLLCYSGCQFSPSAPHNPLPPLPQQHLWTAISGTNWLVTISILGVAVGFFAFLNGSKMGLPFIGACGVALFMSLAVIRFATWIAVLGLLGSVAAIVLSIVVKKKALREIIIGVENVKRFKFNSNEKASVNRLMGEPQSKITEKVVQDIKSTLKAKKEI